MPMCITLKYYNKIQPIETLLHLLLRTLLTQKLSYSIDWLIGASLSKPHTSELSGTSVMFTKIYIEIWIASSVHKNLRLKSVNVVRLP